MGTADFILNHYKDKAALVKPPLPELPDGIVATNYNRGLGDTLSLLHLPLVSMHSGKRVFVHSASEHFNVLKSITSGFEPVPPDNKGLWRVEFAQSVFDCGNGHFFQRIQRAFGLNVQLIPAARFIGRPSPTQFKIVLHLSVGIHAQYQTKIHPRARQLYPEHRATLQQFIKNHPEYDFVEIGTSFSGLEGVRDRTGLSLMDSTVELSDAHFFIGLHSGVMHLAAALDIKSIIIVNFPSPQNLILPALKDINEPDLDWLYPQNVHLHEDGDGELVKIFSLENLEKALDGEVYPFWSAEFLGLIFEKNK